MSENIIGEEGIFSHLKNHGFWQRVLQSHMRSNITSVVGDNRALTTELPKMGSLYVFALPCRDVVIHLLRHKKVNQRTNQRFVVDWNQNQPGV